MHTPPHGTRHMARSDDCAALSGHATAARRESWRSAETRSTASIPHAAYKRRAAWERSAACARAPGHRGALRPTAAPRTCAACSAAAPARACACPATGSPACRRARRCFGTRDGPAPAARLRPAERVGGAQGCRPPWRCASACTCPPLGKRSGRAAELARLGLHAGGHTDRATARHAGSFPGRRPRSPHQAMRRCGADAGQRGSPHDSTGAGAQGTAGRARAGAPRTALPRLQRAQQQRGYAVDQQGMQPPLHLVGERVPAGLLQHGVRPGRQLGAVHRRASGVQECRSVACGAGSQAGRRTGAPA